jgi:glutamyl-tRNA synthetase
MTVRVRIAPSPTGNLHIGTARTAVFNWLFARHHQGTFILRIEDTDLERSKDEYTENILTGLKWLGLNWDEGPFYQSQRLDLYRQAVKELLDKGLAYRCYCTKEELDQMRSQQEAKAQAPRYDNRHRHLTAEQRSAFENEGRKPVIRFIIDDDREISWLDMVRGKVTWKGSDLGGDMVIARMPESDDQQFGQPLYNMAVVVDDIDMKITHVIRGEDHIANTAKQILLYEGFGTTIPEFSHTPLILNKEGRKLSKRDGVTSISDFQNMGYTAEALVNYMSLLGWTSPDSTKEIFTLAEAATEFDFERVNKAGAKFDWDKLNWINGQYIHKLAPQNLLTLLIPYWKNAGYEFNIESERQYLESICELIGPGLNRLDEAVELTRLFFNETVEMKPEAKTQLQQETSRIVIQAIQEKVHKNAPNSAEEAQEIIKKLTKQLNLKKGVIMKALRCALTGDVHGSDLIQSWLLLHQKGWDKTRLEQALLV